MRKLVILSAVVLSLAAGSAMAEAEPTTMSAAGNASKMANPSTEANSTAAKSAKHGSPRNGCVCCSSKPAKPAK